MDSQEPFIRPINKTINPTEQLAIFDEIAEERKRQDAEWDEQNHHPHKWTDILMEEVGEVSKALLEGSLLTCRDELIQVAAVCVAMIESLDRGSK
ncbi:hypothetical protein LCGC14_1921240 [marine sediment metagenome]|uniref:NTP pyrophosphohydrolase MazG putative catalytic core domain-containing protein n=1 Tax=marine sediment metagenome TaxID=412755 RepID=A0A0F9FQK5_9ZZZZ